MFFFKDAHAESQLSREVLLACTHDCLWYGEEGSRFLKNPQSAYLRRELFQPCSTQTGLVSSGGRGKKIDILLVS